MRYEELLEGRDAPLYHGTSYFAASMILEKDTIEARSAHVATKGREQEMKGVSLSRSFALSASFGKIVFTLDQAKLTHNFKLVPVDYWGNMRPDLFKPGEGRRQGSFAEHEEFVVGPITNVSRFILAINGNLDELNQEAFAQGKLFLKTERMVAYDGNRVVPNISQLANFEDLFKHPKFSWVSFKKRGY